MRLALRNLEAIGGGSVLPRASDYVPTCVKDDHREGLERVFAGVIKRTTDEWLGNFQSHLLCIH